MIEFLITLIILPKISIFYRYLSFIIYLVQLFSQMYTVLVNAGIPKKINYLSNRIIKTLELSSYYDKSIFEKYRICKYCNIIIKAKKNSFHCNCCNICLEG